MQQAILLIIISLLFVTLIIPCSIGNYYLDKSYLGIHNTNVIKGVACIMVFVCHITGPGYNDMGNYVSYFSYIGYYAIGLFFFVSGYGLIWNYINKRLPK